MFISDIADINPETKTQFDDQEHINYLDTSNITKNFIGDFHSLVVGKDKIPSRAKRKVIDKDFVYSTVRPNNKHFGFLNDPPEDLVVSTGFVVIRVDPKKANPRFVYEYLTQDKFTAHMQNIGEDSTSTYPGIKPDDLSSIEIDLPSIKKQDFISAFATKIDNKIKLNQKMNKTLEEIAKSLFKSWFIDFDPVRAKAEERPTGLSKEISDLFPDSFEESELGEIPKGWGLIKVEDVAKVTSGKAPPQREISKSDSSPFTIFGGAGPIGFCSKPLEFNKPAIITGRVGTLGKVFFINEECWISDNSILICDAGLYTSIIFSILNLMDMSALNVGSTQPLVTGKDIKNINLIKPPKIVLEKFTSFFDLIKSKQSTLEREVDYLIKLRDTLLPKLISGELKITDAESLVEEVGI